MLYSEKKCKIDACNLEGMDKTKAKTNCDMFWAMASPVRAVGCSSDLCCLRY
jgi:hypothetical protein